MSKEKPSPTNKSEKTDSAKEKTPETLPEEKGGFENRPAPTRYGDWDVHGRCSDF